MKKLTIEQAGFILVNVTNSMPPPRMDCRAFYLEKFENWLNANTEESKPIQARSKSEFRRLKIQGANVEEPRKCPECGGEMRHEHIPDLGQTWKHWKCKDCSKVGVE